MRDKRVLILAFIVLFTFAFINDSFGQNIKSSADYIYVIPVKGVINRGLLLPDAWPIGRSGVLLL
jgi:hypothetical protein